MRNLRKNQKNSMTKLEDDEKRYKKRIYMQRYRQRKSNISEHEITKSILNKRLSFNESRVLIRSTNKVQKHLPTSPRSKIRVVKHLADTYIPTLLKPITREPNENAIPEYIIETVQKYYSSSLISYEAPGKKDLIIVRDSNVGKQKLQKKYLTLTLSEIYESLRWIILTL